MANNRQLIVLLGTAFVKCKTMQNIVPRIVLRHILDTFLTLLSHICYASAPLRCGVEVCCVKVNQFVT
jgi:hypothetical protein